MTTKESDVLLNELKHINKNLEDMKHNYEKLECKFDRFEEKQDRREELHAKTKEDVDIMKGERGIIKWVVPMGVSAIVAFVVTKVKGG